MPELFHGTSKKAAESILKEGFQSGCFASDLMAAIEWSNDPHELVVLKFDCEQSEALLIFSFSPKATKFGGCGQYWLKSELRIPGNRLHHMTWDEIKNHSDYSEGGNAHKSG